MDDSGDELERLRALDPVAGEARPSATDPRAQALFEEITMSDTEMNTRPDSAVTRIVRPRGNGRWLAVAAAAAAVLVGAGVLIAGGENGSSPVAGGDSDQVVTPGGTSTASCVEIYNLANLAKREMAFEGTVTAVEGDMVTFAIGAAYQGVNGDTITLGGALGLGSLTSVGPTPSATVGTRLLVAGDGGFAWSCGFTQPYDSDVAAQWSTTFGG